VRTAQETKAIVHGPDSLPTRIERYTVLRSPHIDRKSREQFEIRTHKRLIDIEEPTGKTIEALNKGLSLPPVVDIKIASWRVGLTFTTLPSLRKAARPAKFAVLPTPLVRPEDPRALAGRSRLLIVVPCRRAHHSQGSFPLADRGCCHRHASGRSLPRG